MKLLFSVEILSVWNQKHVADTAEVVGLQVLKRD